MLRQQNLIIADTSCIILLDKIGEISLLKELFSEVTITSVIKDEFGKELPEWIKVQDPESESQLTILYSILDRGEASAIALALECKDSLLILDDNKARKFARDMNLHYTGTFGVIIEAKRSGIIPSVKILLQKVRSTNFRISTELEQRILTLAGELTS